ncbi:hypothetical protein B7P43_G15113 [Cryptotermes secundus]|uniref:Ionotropic glutamate receptor L-glutamate and glycine-binding domain-containing protein n=1 Tax=Cryptotermes secundus TaxID=105785 RepID=A0A2J7QE93_9NEOP|nr:hypothetical protein B7P43_G15113 [Cryptotermes secundus]
MLLSVAATAHLHNVISAFLEDLALVQQWRSLTLVHCSGDQEFLYWHRKTSASLYVRLLSGDHNLSPLPPEAFTIPMVVLPACSLTPNLIIQVNNRGLLTKMYSWWILVMEGWYEPEEARNATYKRFSRLQAGLASDVNIVSFWTQLTGRGTEVIGAVWDAYKLGGGSPLCTELIARWHYSPERRSGWGKLPQLQSYMDKMLVRSRYMAGVTLKVGVLVGKPDYGFDCRTEQDKQGHLMAVHGYSAHILRTLMDLLHFKVEFIGSGAWGFQDDEGVWVGLLGMLAEGAVDLMVCHPTLTADRTAVALFLHPTLHTRRMLAYRAAGLPLTQDVFVLTFTGSLWLVCLVMALVLLAASFRLASLQTAKFLSGQPKPWTWVEITLWAVAATCQQGFSKVPQGVSCKMVFIIGYMASYLLYTWFAAGVTSLLAVQGQDTNLQLSDVAQMHTDFSASWDGLLPDFFSVRKL